MRLQVAGGHPQPEWRQQRRVREACSSGARARSLQRMRESMRCNHFILTELRILRNVKKHRPTQLTSIRVEENPRPTAIQGQRRGSSCSEA
jgi:hypothetical protein